MTDINVLIKALECSITPLSDKNKCSECQYCIKEEIDPEEFPKYDYEIGGKYYSESCGCDEMVADAIEVIKKAKELTHSIIEIIEKDCPENDETECEGCPYQGEAECISHRKYDLIRYLVEGNL